MECDWSSDVCSSDLVYPDQELTIKISVKEIIIEKNKVIFLTEIFDQNKDLVLTGEALMMPRKDDNDE
jgi:3-hydroxybutyryl-CoA dehydratase